MNFDLSEKKLELVARKFCVIQGQDPDELISHGADPDKNGAVKTVILYSPRWQRMLREIKPPDGNSMCFG